MDCVILFRNTSNGRVGFVSDDSGELKVFPNQDAALDTALDVPVCKVYPYQVVLLDGL